MQQQVKNNITDYIKLYGDYSFTDYKFREADVLVLTQLSYTPFESVVSDSFEKDVFLKDAIVKYIDDSKQKSNEKVLTFLTLLSQSKRYESVKICGFWYGNKCYGEPLQFAAMAFKLFDDLNFIAYRGTDGTLHGWKEDFLFSCHEQTLAQKSALIYLDSALKHLKGQFIVSGHSKGGNLAVFASVFIDNLFKSKILRVYCNDAPGFNEKQNVFDTEEYKCISDKIVCIRPQQSIVGQLLSKFPNCHNYVIHSLYKGVWQHDMFSWEINSNGLLNWHRPQRIEVKYQILMNVVNNKIFSVPIHKRKKLVQRIFDVLENDEVESSEIEKIN